MGRTDSAFIVYTSTNLNVRLVFLESFPLREEIYSIAEQEQNIYHLFVHEPTTEVLIHIKTGGPDHSFANSNTCSLEACALTLSTSFLVIGLHSCA